MTGSQVMVLASDLLLDFSNSLREKFNRGATVGTHHVVMATAVVLVLVTRDPVVKSNLAGQPAIGEQLQGPVNGSESDARVGLFNQPMQFVGGEMFPSLQECPQNGAALFGLLQADALEMLQENSFGLADALRRDARLIVNTFLQHVGFHRRQNPRRC